MRQFSKRLRHSFVFAFKGLATLFRTQLNARIHLIITLFVIAAGSYFEINKTEWCLLLLAIGFVLWAEAFNTALEFLTDLVSPEYHPLAGKTKDVAAAAVLIAAATSALIGLIIFLPKILDRI